MPLASNAAKKEEKLYNLRGRSSSDTGFTAKNSPPDSREMRVTLYVRSQLTSCGLKTLQSVTVERKEGHLVIEERNTILFSSSLGL